MDIRPATEADIPGIVAIYNEVIDTSTAVYSVKPVDLADRLAWFVERTAKGYPVLVALDETGVVGFSTFGDFRSSPGYRYSVEHSVHVRNDQRGRGVGEKLLEALFPPALALGKHVMIGAIDAANHASIRFHEKIGFTVVGTMPEVGRKFGRWLDLVFMQRIIDAPGAVRAD